MCCRLGCVGRWGVISGVCFGGARNVHGFGIGVELGLRLGFFGWLFVGWVAGYFVDGVEVWLGWPVWVKAVGHDCGCFVC